MESDLSRNSIVPAVLELDDVLALGPFAISLHNRGHYGTPEEKGLRLNGFEALHLYELGRIEIKRDNNPYNEKDLVKYFSQKTPNFMLRYLVYKDLRNRGYILNIGQGSSFFFRLYARNTTPKKDGAKYYVTPLQEGGSIALQELDNLVSIAKKSNKILLFGMVDAVGDVSYLQVTQLLPENLSKTKQFSDLQNWDWDSAWSKHLENYPMDNSSEGE
ncbi:MAG: tRNA-intron lyase [Candidatus Kariarchaeaceae archaeon]